MFWPSMVIAPPRGLVEPQDQVEHRGLAAAGRPDQRGHLAGLGDEGHAAEHRLVRPIAEPHVVKTRRAPS